MTLQVSESHPAPLAAEHELKFTLPNLTALPVVRWLRGRCLPDPDHPDGIVVSVYFDSRDLRLLNAKINSDYVKSKVRLRWYVDPRTRTPEGAAFMEMKRKIGGRRFKSRAAVPIPAGEIAGLDLQSSELRRLPGLLRGNPEWIPTDLLPLMEIDFRRRRFIEPTTGARLSLDQDICAARVNPTLLPKANSAPLAHAVFEVKGPSRALPAWLHPLQEMGLKRASFSKYSQCFQKVSRTSSF